MKETTLLEINVHRCYEAMRILSHLGTPLVCTFHPCKRVSLTPVPILLLGLSVLVLAHRTSSPSAKPLEKLEKLEKHGSRPMIAEIRKDSG